MNPLGRKADLRSTGVGQYTTSAPCSRIASASGPSPGSATTTRQPDSASAITDSRKTRSEP